MSRTILEEFGLRSVGKAEVGIEIEMEGTNLNIPEPVQFWDQKADGSLRGSSIEYVLRQPVPREKVDARLKYLQKKLKNPNVTLKPSDRCGVHVHLNFQPNTTEEVFKMIVLYYMLENILVKWCGPSREGNLFCLRAKDAMYIVPHLCYAREHNSLVDMQHSTFRYASCNISSIRKYGTLEFRALQTPKNFNRIYKWVEILLQLKDTALSVENPINLIEQCSMDGYDEFLKYVLGNFYNDLWFNGIEGELMDGVRIIQDLAYTQINPEFTKKKYIKMPSVTQRIYGDEPVTATLDLDIATFAGYTTQGQPIPPPPAPTPNQEDVERLRRDYQNYIRQRREREHHNTEWIMQVLTDPDTNTGNT